MFISNFNVISLEKTHLLNKKTCTNLVYLFKIDSFIAHNYVFSIYCWIWGSKNLYQSLFLKMYRPLQVLKIRNGKICIWSYFNNLLYIFCLFILKIARFYSRSWRRNPKAEKHAPYLKNKTLQSKVFLWVFIHKNSELFIKTGKQKL